MPQPVQLGKKTRISYSKIHEVAQMPNLIQIQTDSYKWFVNEGLKEVFSDISPIKDYAGNLILEFLDHTLNTPDDPPKYSQVECKERDATYAAPLKVVVRLINKETGELKQQEVFMGDFPLMTDKGTFIYNGAERVVVTQLVRSPGPYFGVEFDKNGNQLFTAQIIPNRGAWLEYETDSNEVINVRVDRTRKLPVTTLLRALGLSSDQEIVDTFGSDDRLAKTLEKDPAKNADDGVKEIYNQLRPGEPPTVDNARSLLESLFFEDRRYDLAKVGRYKYNKKLGLSNRLPGLTAAEDVINPATGEILAERDALIDRDTAVAIENAGVLFVHVKSANNSEPDVVCKVIGNNFVNAAEYVDFDVKALGLSEKVHYPTLMEILNSDAAKGDLQGAFLARKGELSPKHVTPGDIIASISYILNLPHGIGSTDDIDHLGNRRVRTVGELLQNQFRIGLARMERVVRERMTIQDVEVTTPQALMNIRPVTAAIKEFFGSSQLSQFMDQNNPLAELTHKRRLSALGPGGLSRERAGFEVRDVHHSHYGRMCPIETPEGPNIGLIGSLTTYGRINEYGFIETPYRKVDKATGVVTEQIDYLTADDEEMLIIAQANEPLDSKGKFANKRVTSRGAGGDIDLVAREDVDYMDVSPKQVVSVATAMIPFLENDDANRALMGSNMQRQAVPLLITDAPIVGTGMEFTAARDSGVVVLAKNAGVVEYVDAETIRIRRENAAGGKVDANKLKTELEKLLAQTGKWETEKGAKEQEKEALEKQLNDRIGLKDDAEQLLAEAESLTAKFAEAKKEKVDALALAPRLAKLLENAGLDTVYKLAAASDEDLRDVEGVGEKSVKEIRKSLEAAGFAADAAEAEKQAGKTGKALKKELETLRQSGADAADDTKRIAALSKRIAALDENIQNAAFEIAEKRNALSKAGGDGEVDVYRLLKFKRSNQSTCVNQRPIVVKGERVEKDEVIADGPATDQGEVALGKNLLIGFMTWEGYNYEDAIILNERLIMDDVLTSLHIEEYEAEARDTKLGPEEITRDIPNVGDDARKDLDEEGIVRIGAEVNSYDILVGKVTPKGETELTAEERLLRAIFGEKAREVRDTSLKVPHGETGIVVDIKTFSRDAGDELPPGVNKLVRVYVVTKRKISVGDKMAGRHGNKGVISRILPEEDMPFMEDGTPLQVMLNPLGVPSRMNVGQVLEVHLGLVAQHKGWYVSTPVFDGANEKDIVELLKECGYPRSGKLHLRDGRTGEKFDNPVTVGYMYMLKLHHLVDDKIHA
ncbi:MAG: hypothetical protein LBO81_07485, partial [Clostridiales Family XIII bacterium]|nr:hypothetical protein [Clostridiales Family XIII bacterium]